MISARSKSIAFLSLSDPYVTQHGGTLRTRGLIHGARELGATPHVLFPNSPIGAAFSPSAKGVASGLRASLGRAKRQLLPMPTLVGARDRELEARLHEAKPDLVVVSALSQSQIALNVGAPVWLDFMDLWSEFALRESDTRRGLSKATARMQSAHLKGLERRFSGQATHVTCVGWSENESLRKRDIDSKWLPVTLPDSHFSRRTRTNEDQPVLGMIGNFHFWPNRDAVELLFEEWLPRVRDAGWRVLLAGNGSEQFSDPASDIVDVLGPIASVDDFYSRVDATTAPVRLGGGMKVKVLESLAKGVPVVGTGFALDGFPPATSEMAHVWESNRGQFPRLDDLSTPDPSDPRLDPFRESNLVAFMGDLLGLTPGVENSGEGN